MITSSGQSQNEDLGRYFGYDSGINNYLKLPANLTFQSNQSGEFTEITYIFLALLPSTLLFVASRRKIFGLFSFGIVIAMTLYYFYPPTRYIITSFFSTIDLKEGAGYGVILAMNLFYVTFAHFFIEETETNKKLKEILMFMGVYGFIFLISAFGIVWYGIFAYFAFFVIIGLAVQSFEKYSQEEEHDE